jgi:hypothetical protein
MPMPKTYKCVFCEKEFSRRSWYDKHQCAKKKRFSEANNLTAIMAQKLFAHWKHVNHFKKKTKLSPMAEFVASPLYNAFKKLALFTQTRHVISAHKYLDWLILQKIPERRWTMAKNLDAFLVHMREAEGVQEHVERSFRNIRAWCMGNGNVPVAEFFTKINPLEALIMVRQNRLMPWVLLGYDRSVKELVDRFGQDQVMVLDEFINLEYWLTKMEEHPDKKALAHSLSEEQLGQTA